MTKPSNKFLLLGLLMTAIIATWAAAHPMQTGNTAALSGPAASAQKKLDALQQNADSADPRPLVTTLSEAEINAYLNSSAVKLPVGVHSAHLVGSEGTLNGAARVNFDEIRAGRGSANPLLALFSGTHDVNVQAHGSGAGGRGNVDVDSVEIDGTAVPRFALEYFVDHYLKPKYPGIGMHSTFALPDRIDSATIGRHQLTLVQK